MLFFCGITWHITLFLVKKKIKCTLVHVLRLCTGRTANRGSRGIALLYRHWGSVQAVRPIGVVEVQLYSFLTTVLEGVRGQRHAPPALYPRELTRYALCRRPDGPQGRYGQVRKISPSPRFDPRFRITHTTCYLISNTLCRMTLYIPAAALICKRKEAPLNEL